MLNKQDINNIIIFLNRATLNGNEAQELVRLQGLLISMLEDKPKEIKELPAD